LLFCEFADYYPALFTISGIADKVQSNFLRRISAMFSNRVRNNDNMVENYIRFCWKSTNLFCKVKIIFQIFHNFMHLDKRA